MDDIQINTTSFTRTTKSFKNNNESKNKNNTININKRKSDQQNGDGKEKRFKSESNDSSSKAAKFSSLFKNNADIPVIKKLEDFLF